jgi:GntR family transcriptional repressor for pyruvate dehydrogenase complex
MKTTFADINRDDTLVNLVMTEIKNRIIDGEFRPGDALPSQGKLAEMFSVSMTVIREAFHKLQLQGLIDISQGKRARIKEFDTKATVDILETCLQLGISSMTDLVEVRRALEGEIACLAAERATGEDIRDLEKTFQQIISAETIEDKIGADFRFHRRLALCTRNNIFVLLVDTMCKLMKQSQMNSYIEVGLKRRIDPHDPVLGAVRNHDGASARKAMSDHLSD